MQLNTEISNFSDLELVDEYKKSTDKEYVAELFNRYYDFVFFVSMKYLQSNQKSKDAVMGVFEKLMKDLLKSELRNFKSWLHVVTKNYCLHIIRSENISSKHKEIIKAEQENFMENYDQMDHIDETDNKFVYDALKELKEEQRVCVEMFYFEELSYEQISEKTNYEIKKVKSYIQNGKRNLKNIITKKDKNISSKLRYMMLIFSFMLN